MLPKDAVDCANAAINAVGAVMAKIKPGMRAMKWMQLADSRSLTVVFLRSRMRPDIR